MCGNQSTTVTGVEQSVVLVTMASRSKEESQTDPLEDFVDFCRSMKNAGFGAQIPWSQSLNVPGEECLGLGQVTVTGDLEVTLTGDRCDFASFPDLRSYTQLQWDFSANGRLFFLYNDLDSAVAENHFASLSELGRTGRAPNATLISTQDMVTIGTAADSERVTVRYMPSTRSAQKGTDASFQLYKSLLSTSKLRKPHLTGLLKPNDEVHMVDLHAHVGDHCLATMLMKDEVPTGVTIKHFIVQLATLKSSVQSAEWCSKRLGHWLAQRWMKHELKLELDGKAISPDIDCQVFCLHLFCLFMVIVPFHVVCVICEGFRFCVC